MADFDEMLEKSKKTTDEPLHSNRADGLSVNDKDASLSVFGGQFDFANADIFKDVLDAPEQEHPEEDKVSELPSYESDMHVRRKKRNWRSILAAAFICVICAALVGAVWMLIHQRKVQQTPGAIEPVQAVEETPQVQAENDAHDPVRVKAKGFPVSFSSKAIHSVCAVGAHLYVLTDETLSLVTSTGAYQLMKVIGYVEPVMRSCGKYGLVFDRLTGKYLIFANDKIIYENNTEEKSQILAADIAADGSFLIARKGDESASVLSYYDHTGQPLFQWSCAKDHIVSVCLAENKHDILCAALNAENGEIVTKLYQLDVYSDQTQWEYKLKGAAAMECFFVSSNKVCAVCTDRRVIIDSRKSKAEPNVFTYPETLLAIDSNDGNTAVVTPKFGSFDSYEVRLLNDNNKVIYTFETDARVIDIRCVGKRAYLLTENAVLAVNPNGKGSVVTPIGDVELGLDVLNGQIYHYSLGYLFKN